MKTLWVIDESDYDSYTIYGIFEEEEEARRTLNEMEKSMELKRGEYSRLTMTTYVVHEKGDKGKIDFRFDFSKSGGFKKTTGQYLLNGEETETEVIKGPWGIQISQASETYEDAKEKVIKKVEELLKE